jgi:type I restriction enzyme S subunit
MVKLGDIAVHIRNGASIKQNESSSGLPISRIETIANREVNFDKCGYADLGPEDYKEYRLASGDILISHINSEKHLGKCAIFESDRDDLVHGMNLLCMRPKDTVFPKFVFYYLSSDLFLSKIPNITKKSVNQASFTVTSFKELEIPLPPLAEQKRIAAILDKADAIRRKRQQAIQLADDFLRAVFLEIFGDPVTNPKGLEVKPMQKLIKIQGGYAFKSEDFSESGIPVVKIGNANKVGFTTKGISFIQPDNPNKLKQYELYAGDLLMSLTGTVGKDDYANVTEVTDEYDMYYLNQRVAKISVINGQITKNFIKHYLAHPKIKSEITKNNRGVRQANIGNADIYELSVPVPSNSMLEKFDMLVEQASLLITKIDSAPSQNDSFFNALSQKVFSGQP